MNSTPTPAERSWAITRNSGSTSWRLREAVGSSITITRASKLTARAISSSCSWATDNVRAGRLTSRSRPSASMRAWAVRRHSPQSTRPNRPGRWSSTTFSATERSAATWRSW